jgi:outer membrane protein OmpA-like peptidoglycan-associated protein
MKKYITPIIIIFSLAACIPPGKLNESLDANTLLTKKYDTLNNKLNDTVASFSASLSSLKGSINSLKDSVTYYRSLVAAGPAQSQGDVFLNQMFGYSLLSTSELAGIKAANISNNVNNIWLESFKADVKKYSVADVDIKLNKGYVFVDIPSNIMFASGSASLSSQSIEMLGGIARLLEAQPNLNFLIEGHTDNVGDDALNLELSNKRAAAVRNYLIKKGINPARMTSQGFGETKPVGDNNTASGRALNRRVELNLRNF